MVKGGMLKDDADWNTLGIKEGHTFMMMGSAEEDIPKAPVEKPVFVEDLSTEDLASMDVRVEDFLLHGCNRIFNTVSYADNINSLIGYRISSWTYKSWKYLLYERYPSVFKGRSRASQSS
jgi:hypothetical protein